MVLCIMFDPRAFAQGIVFEFQSSIFETEGVAVSSRTKLDRKSCTSTSIELLEAGAVKSQGLRRSSREGLCFRHTAIAWYHVVDRHRK